MYMAYAVIPGQLSLTGSTLPPYDLTSLRISPSLVQKQFLQGSVRDIFLSHSSPAPNIVIKLEKQSSLRIDYLPGWRILQGVGMFPGMPLSGVWETVPPSVATGVTQSCPGYSRTSNHKVNFLSQRFMSPESPKNNTVGLTQCPKWFSPMFPGLAQHPDIYSGLGLPGSTYGREAKQQKDSSGGAQAYTELTDPCAERHWLPLETSIHRSMHRHIRLWSPTLS